MQSCLYKSSYKNNIKVCRPNILLHTNRIIYPKCVNKIQNKIIQYHKVFKNNPKCNDKLLALSLGQMLCSIATFMHDAYLPIYVQCELGMSNSNIGAIQGISQFLCQLTKGVSGVIGDIFGSQVKVVLFGTLLTLICKPMFALLSTINNVAGLTAAIYWLFFAKLFDRMSKGIREAPTKAIMNQLASDSGETPDKAYGFRQSIATLGMMLGSTIASVVFISTGRDYVKTFIASIIPPLIAFIWLFVKFNDDDNKTINSEKNHSVNFFEIIHSFKPGYWYCLLIISTLYFARFDSSFITLRAKNVMDKNYIPMLFLVSSLIQVVTTVPFSKYSSISIENRNTVLGVGFIFMIISDFLFSCPLSASMPGMFLAITFLGFHMAMTHSTTQSMIASYMPLGNLAGTAVSFTDFILGFVLATSNFVAGYLSDIIPNGCFVGGSIATFSSLVLLILFTSQGYLETDLKHN